MFKYLLWFLSIFRYSIIVLTEAQISTFINELQWRNRLRHCVNHDKTRKNDKRHARFGVHWRSYMLKKSRTQKIGEVGPEFFANDLWWWLDLHCYVECVKTISFHILCVGIRPRLVKNIANRKISTRSGARRICNFKVFKNDSWNISINVL